MAYPLKEVLLLVTCATIASCDECRAGGHSAKAMPASKVLDIDVGFPGSERRHARKE